jgi:ATP-dependent RNA helicase DHX33
MNAFPLSPPHSRALLASISHRCVSPVLSILSLLSSGSKLFFDPPDSAQRDAAAEARAKFRHPSGDHLTMLAALRAYEEVSRAEGKAGRREWCRRHFLNERALGEAVDIQEQLRGICVREGIEWEVGGNGSDGGRVDEEPVLRSLLVGMAQHTAILRNEGGYKQVLGHSVRADRSRLYSLTFN